MIVYSLLRTQLNVVSPSVFEIDSDDLVDTVRKYIGLETQKQLFDLDDTTLPVYDLPESKSDEDVKFYACLGESFHLCYGMTGVGSNLVVRCLIDHQPGKLLIWMASRYQTLEVCYMAGDPDVYILGFEKLPEPQKYNYGRQIAWVIRAIDT
jgi:hypothetical protein